MLKDPKTLTTKDYIYCSTCQMYVDFWKYGHSIRDAGHSLCNWRYVTPDELTNCIEDCLASGCFDEEIVCVC